MVFEPGSGAEACCRLGAPAIIQGQYLTAVRLDLTGRPGGGAGGEAGLAMQERSCALVVIGNEILSGKIHDTNTYFAARELRGIGVALKRIAVVPDEIDAIAEEVRYCAQRFEFVITSGGVGPTHDDITIAGVAAALGRPVVIHPQLETRP